MLLTTIGRVGEGREQLGEERRIRQSVGGDEIIPAVFSATSVSSRHPSPSTSLAVVLLIRAFFSGQAEECFKVCADHFHDAA